MKHPIFKKLMGLLLALALLATGLVALAEEVIISESGVVENPEAIVAGENELIFWSLFSGGEGNYMEGLVEQYNATNPKMTVRNVKLNWGEYYTKLITAVSVGKGPDIGISHIAKLPELHDQGVVLPMDEYANAMSFDWSQVNQNTLEAATIDGQVYAVPLDTHPEVFFYNKTILREAGLLNEQDELDLPQDADAFYQFMLDMKAKLPEDIYPLALSSAGDDPWRLVWAMYYQMDGAPVITSDLEIKLEKDKFVAVLDYFKQFYDNGIIPINLEDFYSYFMNLRGAATFITGVWATSSLENIEGLEFGVQSFPVLFGKNAQWGDSHTFILPVTPQKDAERMTEAMKFFDFVSKNSIVWASAGHVVANVNVLASEEFAALPYRSDYADVANHVVFFEPNPYSYPIRAAMIQQIDAFLAGNQTAEETYDNIVLEIEEITF